MLDLKLFLLLLVLNQWSVYGKKFNISIGLLLYPEHKGYEQIVRHVLEEKCSTIDFKLEVEETKDDKSVILPLAMMKKHLATIISSDPLFMPIPSYTPIVSIFGFSFMKNLFEKSWLEIKPETLPAAVDLTDHLKWHIFTWICNHNNVVERGSCIAMLMNFRKMDAIVIDAEDTVAKLKASQASSLEEKNVIINVDPKGLDDILNKYYTQSSPSERQKITFLLLQPVSDKFWEAPYVKELNVIGFQLYDSESEPVHEFIKYMNMTNPDLESALLFHDAALLIAETFTKMPTERLRQFDPSNMSMYKDDGDMSFTDGKMLTQLYKRVHIPDGLTGSINFNYYGRRENYTLSIIKSGNGSAKKIFTWSDKGGLKPFLPVDNAVQSDSPTVDDKPEEKKEKLIVTTLLHEPYVMVKKNDSSGKDVYSGFIIDLLDYLSLDNNVTYEIRLVRDGLYGSYNPETNTWTGMIGEIVNGKADLAAADLTITSPRLRIVDFIPFANIGITMLLKKPSLNQTLKDADSPYFFVNGFTATVWVCVLMAYVGISLVVFFVSKFTQLHELPIGIWDGLSYSFGTIFFRKNNMRTKIVSVKFVSGVWWLFTFFLVVLYVSSMSSNIMVQLLGIRAIIERQNILSATCQSILEGFVKTGKPQVGLLLMGSTHAFFKNSRIATFHRYAEKIASDQSIGVRNFKEGVNRVRYGGGNFALLIESSSSKYITNRDCDLYVAAGSFDAKQYGLALPHDSPYKGQFRHTLLKMQETGLLRALEDKWWLKLCNDDDEDWLRLRGLDHTPVSLSQMSGVFYFLLAGIALTFVIFGVEFFMRRRKGNGIPTNLEERQELTSEEDSHEIQNMVRNRL